MNISSIIVASGESRRMGFDKLTADLGGVPVLRRTIDAFRNCDLVGQIIVVCPPDRFDACDLDLDDGTPVIRVDGGASRQLSVANGLAAVHEDALFVAVHDGARPMVTTEIITNCYHRAREFGAACAARRVTETLKRSDPDGFTRSSVDRRDLWITETPQMFRTRILRRAFDMVAEQNATVTDEVSAVELLGISSFLVQSLRPNPKITHPWDLELATSLLQ